jgi:hypothetical protein
MKRILVVVGIAMVLTLFMTSASYAAPPAWGGDCGGGGGTHHCVRYGETLFSIGRHYGVDPYYIAHVNGLKDPNYIYAGQILYIPSGHPYPEQPVHRPDKCHYDYCGGHGKYHQGYGYDYTGYYYDAYYPKYKRYSYTCGYYYNCY